MKQTKLCTSFNIVLVVTLLLHISADLVLSHQTSLSSSQREDIKGLAHRKNRSGPHSSHIIYDDRIFKCSFLVAISTRRCCLIMNVSHVISSIRLFILSGRGRFYRTAIDVHCFQHPLSHSLALIPNYVQLINTAWLKLLPSSRRHHLHRNVNESQEMILIRLKDKGFLRGQITGYMDVITPHFNRRYNHFLSPRPGSRWLDLIRHGRQKRSTLSRDKRSLTGLTPKSGATEKTFPLRSLKSKRPSRVSGSHDPIKRLNTGPHKLLNDVLRNAPTGKHSMIHRTYYVVLDHNTSIISTPFFTRARPLCDSHRSSTDSLEIDQLSPIIFNSSFNINNSRTQRPVRRSLRSVVHHKDRKLNDHIVPMLLNKDSYYDNVEQEEDDDKPQPVTLSMVVHLNVDRGYERDLQAALIKGINSREFAAVRKYIAPSGQFIALKYDRPRDILQSFCDDILMSNTTTVFHLVNPFYHSRSWSSAQFVSNLLSTLDMPVISWGPEYIGTTDKRESDNLQLNISPTLHHQASAMLSVLRHYNWTDFSLVYTPDTGHDAFITAVRILVHDMNNQSGRKGFKFNILEEVQISNTSNDTSIQQDLKKLIKSEARIVLLYCIEKDTIKILEAASRHGLMTDEYLWFLTFEAINKNKLKVANNLPVGIFGVSYEYEENEMKKAIETSVNLWLKALQQSVHSTSVKGGPPTGLPWQTSRLQCQSRTAMRWTDGPKFFQFLRNVALDNIRFNELGQPVYKELYIVNVQPPLADEEDQKWTQVGLFTPDGIQMQHITWPNGARTPPSGKPKRHFLQIVTREEPPFVEYREPSQNGSCGHSSYSCHVFKRDINKIRLSEKSVQRCCTGLSIEFLHRLSMTLNFDFNLTEVEDYQWGSKNADGTWNGIVGDLVSGKADMAVASMTIDEDRSTAINFSLPYMETGITFIVAIREGAISATAFLEPYDLPSWCLILVCSVHVTGTSIFLFEWFSPYGLDHGKKLSSKYRFSLFRTFWLMWAMLFGAAVTTDTPRGVSSKFMSNIWALFALVFSASYTANLAAFMITKEEYYDLSGLHDWRLQRPHSMSPPFRFATIANGTTESNIKKHNISMHRYMKRFTQTSVEDAIKAIKSNQLHAFIYDASVLKYQEGKDKDCRLITVGNWFATTGFGVGFPIGSPWLERVNSVILNLQYEGEMERLKEFWLTGACHMKRKKTTNSRGIGNGVSSSTLGILNFTSAFILLAAGTGLAVLTLILEHFYFCFARKKLRSWDKKDCCTLVSLSMGMSLSFQGSDYLKKAKEKCKSPLCETKLWKAQFELKQARQEIQRLQSELARLTLEGANTSKWCYEHECGSDTDVNKDCQCHKSHDNRCLEWRDASEDEDILSVTLL